MTALLSSRPALSSDPFSKLASGGRLKSLLSEEIEFEKYDKQVDMDAMLDLGNVKVEVLNPKKRKIDGANGELNGKSNPGKFSYTSGEASSSRQKLSNGQAKTPKDDLWPHSISLTYPTSAKEQTGKGLWNLGNTCFANSIIQVFMHTPPVLNCLEAIIRQARTAGGKYGHHGEGGFCMTCQLGLIQSQMWGNEQNAAIRPLNLVKNVTKICPSMRPFHQEDAHEYLRCAIDVLHNDALKYAKAKKAPHAIQDTTWVHKVWGGKTRSRVHCNSCGNDSDTFETFLDLSLDLPQKTSSSVDLRQALKTFTATDHLNGRNKYKCDKCKRLVDAEKSVRIVKLPPVLSLHLKRFTPFGRKLTYPVTYHETIDMGRYTDKPNSNSSTYELYAVTCHQGSGPHIGHYYSYVKARNGRWYAMNDEERSGCKLDHVLNQKNAYILHYMMKRGSKLDAIVNSAPNGTTKNSSLPPLANGSSPSKKQVDDERRLSNKLESGSPAKSPLISNIIPAKAPVSAKTVNQTGHKRKSLGDGSDEEDIGERLGVHTAGPSKPRQNDSVLNGIRRADEDEDEDGDEEEEEEDEEEDEDSGGEEIAAEQENLNAASTSLPTQTKTEHGSNESRKVPSINTSDVAAGQHKFSPILSGAFYDTKPKHTTQLEYLQASRSNSRSNSTSSSSSMKSHKKSKKLSKLRDSQNKLTSKAKLSLQATRAHASPYNRGVSSQGHSKRHGKAAKMQRNPNNL